MLVVIWPMMLLFSAFIYEIQLCLRIVFIILKLPHLAGVWLLKKKKCYWAICTMQV